MTGNNGESGFTLIEVLIAMVILAVSITILVEGYISINDSFARHQQYTYLSSWAETKLQEIKGGFDYSYSGSFRYQSKNYNWWIEEEYLDQDFKKLILKIEWDSKRGQDSYRLKTIVHR